MAVSDQDIELLENYLDDEASVADVNGLRARLACEPAMALKLADLRSARMIRKSVFASMELSDEGAARLMKNVKDTARRNLFRNRFNTYARYIGAAAACVVIGFTTGWLGRSGGSGSRVGFDSPATSSGAVSPSTPVGASLNRPPVYGGGSFGSIPTTPGGGAFSVTVTDESGRVIAVQRFDTLEEARRFSDEVSTLQGKPKSPRDRVILPGAGEQF